MLFHLLVFFVCLVGYIYRPSSCFLLLGIFELSGLHVRFVWLTNLQDVERRFDVVSLNICQPLAHLLRHRLQNAESKFIFAPNTNAYRRQNQRFPRLSSAPVILYSLTPPDQYQSKLIIALPLENLAYRSCENKHLYVSRIGLSVRHH